MTTVAVAGKDAILDIGAGTLISRASNTISDVMEGVTLTLTKADVQTAGVFDGPPVTVSVKKDADGHRRQGAGARGRRERRARRRQEPDRDGPR
jgi:flagellar capping protein FliD